MLKINGYTRFGYVEGLGDEEVPGWIAPYVRDFVALAKSSATREAEGPATVQTELALASLTRRIAQTAAVARVASHMKGGEPIAAGISGALAAEIEDYCGTPPHPHRLAQAALAVAVVASGLAANDPAKSVLVTQVERLQNLLGQQQPARLAQAG